MKIKPGLPEVHVNPVGACGGYKQASQLPQHTTGSVTSLVPTLNTLLVYVALPFVHDAVGSFIS